MYVATGATIHPFLYAFLWSSFTASKHYSFTVNIKNGTSKDDCPRYVSQNTPWHSYSHSKLSHYIIVIIIFIIIIITSIEAHLRRASLLRCPTPATPMPVLLTPTIPTPALLRLLRHTTEGWLMSRNMYSIGTP